MNYVLVIQFNQKDFSDDELLPLMETLETDLKGVAEVDGYDVGCGEINFFIVTDNPKATFNLTQTTLGNKTNHNYKAAYRNLDGEEYTILWPIDLKEFSVA